MAALAVRLRVKAGLAAALFAAAPAGAAPVDDGWKAYEAGDYSKARTACRAAADAGDASCQVLVGNLYLKGQGVKVDYALAERHFRATAQQGNSGAEQALGWLYYNGWGVKKDDAEAARLFLAASEQGNPLAPNGIGFCLKSGRGAAKDYAQAIRWFRTGVERGDLAHSATSLGFMYENGEGLTQDYVEAYKWFLIGAAHDNPYARPGVERLKALTTKEQIAEAQKLAATFEASSHGQAAASTAPSPAAQAPSSHASAVDTPSFKGPERPDDLALVVGVESYSLKDLPAAAFAERDADAFAAHARALGVPERNLRVLKGSDATAGKLRGYRRSWLPKNVKPGSRVYFYFSGHGAPNPQTGDAYLLPWDGDPALLKETAEPLKDVYLESSIFNVGRAAGFDGRREAMKRSTSAEREVPSAPAQGRAKICRPRITGKLQISNSPFKPIASTAVRPCCLNRVTLIHFPPLRPFAELFSPR